MVLERKVEAIFRLVEQKLDELRRLPSSTYRIQFNRDFTFAQATAIVPYLDSLGITDLYASPYLKARPESMHGYDITDHNSLNPSIGDMSDHVALSAALRRRNMGQILDVVPNHMGIGEPSNSWWMDVLESGPSSLYAPYFDINWRPLKPELTNKLLLPILGDQYGAVLENGELQLSYEDGTFYIHYYGNTLPVAPKSYANVLRVHLDDLVDDLGADNPLALELQSILTALNHLPDPFETAPERVAERHREKEIIKRRLSALYDSSEEIQEAIDDAVRLFNGTRGDRHSFDRLDDLLNRQTYRLSFWRVAAEEINYRRFFDINDLAAVRIELPAVFEETHRLIFQFLAEGKITGLRIDHPDGLWDPQGYLTKLQERYFLDLAQHVWGTGEWYVDETEAEEAENSWEALEPSLLSRYRAERVISPEAPVCYPLYLVVEKILSSGERLREDWPVHGTTGYEFGILLNGLFVNADSRRALDETYTTFTNMRESPRDAMYEAKKFIMNSALSSEINLLTNQINHISEQDRRTRDFTRASLGSAITEVIASFPVYRTYVQDCTAPMDRPDRVSVETAVSRAKRRTPASDTTVVDFLRDVLLLRYPEESDNALREQWCNFVKKFQQTTGAVMAKGLEDTTFYRYVRLLSLNEVGGDLDLYGVKTDAFHEHNADYQRRWPYSMLSTSTHDSKRSEDVRARLNVLSEMQREWRIALRRWGRMNQRKKAPLDGVPVPTRNDEYLMYQTLLGVWPPEAMEVEAFLSFRERIGAYMLKAVKEAKLHTSWLNPDTAYDEAVNRFVMAVLDDSGDSPFLADFQTFQQRIAHFGYFNSLSQVVLKIASPGVPDIYQGNEVWQFNLVDPDNRRQIDFTQISGMLKRLRGQIGRGNGDHTRLTRELLEAKEDGRIKLYVTTRSLEYRREHPRLFTAGEYIPLDANGDKATNLCAFMRRYDGETAIAVAPRLIYGLTGGERIAPTGSGVWGDTVINLPQEYEGAIFRNLFTGETIQVKGSALTPQLPLADVLATSPVALLEAVHE